MVIAVVGAGGKTTLIHRMAAQYRAAGRTVLITTSTHMRIESDTILTAEAAPILAALREKGCAMAGVPEGEKISALPPAAYAEVCRAADIVLLEADGARGLLAKYPGSGEPVLYDNIDEVIVVCNLKALGQPLQTAVHRPELAAAALGVTPETPLTLCHIQTLLQKGYLTPLRRRLPGTPVRLHSNTDGSLFQRAAAALLEAEQDASILRQEWFAGAPQLVICGGGHVAQALAEMAVLLDFSVTVLDDREEFANAVRFPNAQVCCDSFAALHKHLQPGAYYVVATRGHEYDRLCAEKILPTEYRYLGMIGSKAKVAATLAALRQAGFTPQQMATLHAPIGLAISAQTPAEIAVSILAEIIAEKNSRPSGSAPQALLQSRAAGTLCIITEKIGSAPRGVGSMMLVTQNGALGSIGGGVVELAATELARRVRTPQTESYQLGKSEGASLGMVCGGSNTVLFIPLREDETEGALQ